MARANVVGSVVKPTRDQIGDLLETYSGRQSPEIVRQLIRGELTGEQVQALIEHRNPFPEPTVPAEAATLTSHRPHTAEESPRVEVFNLGDMEGWARYYNEELGLVMPNNLNVPAFTDEMEWVVVERVNLCYEPIIAKCRTRYTMSLYDENLDQSVPADKELQPAEWIQQGAWRVVRCRARVEPDEELKDRSANWLAQKQIITMNLRQRLVLGDRYFLGTKRHLDITNYTLCAGSRDRRGRVPHAGSGGTYVYVLWYCARDPDALLRARAVLGENAPT